MRFWRTVRMTLWYAFILNSSNVHLLCKMIIRHNQQARLRFSVTLNQVYLIRMEYCVAMIWQCISWPSTGLLSGPWGRRRGNLLSSDIIPEQGYYMHAIGLYSSIMHLRHYGPSGLWNVAQLTFRSSFVTNVSGENPDFWYIAGWGCTPWNQLRVNTGPVVLYALCN